MVNRDDILGFLAIMLMFAVIMSAMAHCQTTVCNGDICTVQVAGPASYLPPGSTGPKGGSWGYASYQLRQGPETFSFMSEEGWWEKPTNQSHAYSVDLPDGETNINAVSGNLSGISWCGNTGFWVQILDERAEPVLVAKVDLIATPGIPKNFLLPVSAIFPNGLRTSRLEFIWYDDLCTPATQSWALVFKTGKPQPEEFCPVAAPRAVTSSPKVNY